MKILTGLLTGAVILCASCSTLTTKPAFYQKYNARISFNTINRHSIDNGLEKTIKNANKQLAGIIKIPDKLRTLENTLIAIDDISNLLWRFGGPVYLMAYVHTDKALRDKCQKTISSLEAFSTGLFLNKKLYNALLLFSKLPEAKRLKGEYAKYLKDSLRSFRRNGMGLNNKKRKSVRLIRNKLSRLSLAFQRNINEYSNPLILNQKQMQGMSKTYKNSRKQKDGTYKIDLSYPSFFPFMRYAMNSEARKKLLYKFRNKAWKKNPSILKQVLILRKQLANLLGYKNYAQYVLETRMAKKPITVMNFENKLEKSLQIKAKKDIAILLKLKKDKVNKNASLVNPWDIYYLSNLAKKTYYNLDSKKVREYFTVPNTVKGLFYITQKLYGLSYKKIKSKNVWHKDVSLYEAYRKKTGKLIGRFYLDLYPRKGKYGHAAMFGLISGKKTTKGYQIPITALVCNFPRPTKLKPGLLSHNQVETFFHEFGHCLHDLLTKARISSFAGTSVSRDFVEMPSQMFENWVWSPKILSIFAKHYKTGKTIPGALVLKMLKTRNFLSGYNNLVQVFYGKYDMTLNTTFNPHDKLSTSKLYINMRHKITGIKPLARIHADASFGHLMGYAAGYYGYLWSKVYAEDVFNVFKKHGLLNSRIGRKFADTILSKGSTEEPQKLLYSFLGRKPNDKTFLRKIGLIK